MNYMDEIFLRADLQQIREFLLRGGECGVDPRPYKERIDCVQERMVARLSREYPDREDYEEMVRLLFESVGTVEDVYMEIGLQAGMILAAQVCQNLKAAFAGE